MKDKYFVDTNILMYAHDTAAGASMNARGLLSTVTASGVKLRFVKDDDFKVVSRRFTRT